MYNIKESIFKCIFFEDYLPNAAAKEYEFCFYTDCRIAKNCSLWGQSLSLLVK